MWVEFVGAVIHATRRPGAGATTFATTCTYTHIHTHKITKAQFSLHPCPVSPLHNNLIPKKVYTKNPKRKRETERVQGKFHWISHILPYNLIYFHLKYCSYDGSFLLEFTLKFISWHTPYFSTMLLGTKFISQKQFSLKINILLLLSSLEPFHLIRLELIYVPYAKERLQSSQQTLLKQEIEIELTIQKNINK